MVAVGARIETPRSSVLLPTHGAYETRVHGFSDYVRQHTGMMSVFNNDNKNGPPLN